MATTVIFAQPWWLEAVAPGTWGEVRVEKGEELFARLPYVIRKRHGFTCLCMPPLTQTLGPWLRPYPGKYASRLTEEKELMSNLIDQLPVFDSFEQRFHHSITNWLPFYWRGFQQTTRYTYILPDLCDPDAIWAQMHENTRWEIRKGERRVGVRDDLGLEAFLALNEMVFRRQGLRPPYSRELVGRLDAACQAHRCRKVLFAEDSQGRLHAAVYVVWDEQAAYYLMGGGDPELRSSGATSLLLWEAIRFSSTVARSFDFEGSVMEHVEHFFRAFGARQVPYFQVTKVRSMPLRVRSDIDSWLRLIYGR